MSELQMYHVQVWQPDDEDEHHLAWARSHREAADLVLAELGITNRQEYLDFSRETYLHVHTLPAKLPDGPALLVPAEQSFDVDDFFGDDDGTS